MARPEDKGRLGKAIGALFAVLPAGTRICDRLTLEAYGQALADLSIDDIEEGCTLALQRCEFVPAPATIRDLAGAGQKADSEAAWELALAVIHGKADESDLPPPVAQTLRQLGGAFHLGGIKSEELYAWKRKEFLDLYPDVVARVGRDHRQLEGEQRKQIETQADAQRWDVIDGMFGTGGDS